MVILLIELLEQTGAIRLLIYLYTHCEGGCKISHLKQNIRISQVALYNAVKNLVKLGLVEEKVTDYPKFRLINITSRGKVVTEKLLEIKQFLEQEPIKKEIKN